MSARVLRLVRGERSPDHAAAAAAFGAFIAPLAPHDAALVAALFRRMAAAKLPWSRWYAELDLAAERVHRARPQAVPLDKRVCPDCGAPGSVEADGKLFCRYHASVRGL